jgi:hypothetical protein
MQLDRIYKQRGLTVDARLEAITDRAVSLEQD